jgi:hypothetical protein
MSDFIAFIHSSAVGLMPRLAIGKWWPIGPFSCLDLKLRAFSFLRILL